MKNKQQSFFLFLFCLLLFANNALAQEFVGGFVADEYDPRSIDSNPAILSFQNPMFISGMQIYHLGIVDKANTFRQMYFGLSSPFVRGNLGIGAHANVFQSPIFRRSKLATTLAYRFFRKISLGVSFNAMNFGYDLDSGTLVDANDPVFSKGTSRTTWSLDAGLNIVFNSIFNIAVGMRDINQPLLSLKDNSVRDPREFFAGAAFRQGPFRFMAEAEMKDNQVRSKFSAEISSSDGKYLRMGYSPDNLSPNLDLQLPLFSGFKLKYSYSLPITRFGEQTFQGSHSFALIFDFQRLRGLPALPPIRVPVVGPQISESLAKPVGQMLASASTNHVNLLEREIIRTFDKTVTRQDIAHLSPSDLGLGDVSMELNPVQFATDTTIQIGKVEPMGVLTSPQYSETFQTISALLKEGKKPKVYLVAPSPYLYRAEQVKQKYLDGKLSLNQRVLIAKPVFHSKADSLKFFAHLNPASIKLTEQYIKAQPDSVLFTIFDGRFSEYGHNWQLEIRDAKDKIINQLFGTGRQEQISWNLRDRQGKILQPGLYYYALSWQDASGVWQRSPRQKLYIKKFKRTLHITVTKNAKKLKKMKSNDIHVFFRK